MRDLLTFSTWDQIRLPANGEYVRESYFILTTTSYMYVWNDARHARTRRIKYLPLSHHQVH